MKATRLWRAAGYESRLPYKAGRRWTSDLTYDLQWSIQQGTIAYEYRDVPCLKIPFEMALYTLLFWKVKPRTIFEIGSKAGGSALWMSDQMRTYGVDTKIISIDIAPPSPPYQRDEITFLRGDASGLDRVLTTGYLQLPHPWIVIEDSSHHYRDTLAVLRFFHPHMQSGEYVVVEDGNVSDMGNDQQREGGPCRAISEFLMEHRDEYTIDASYSDRYGHNVTGNPNGYLRRR